MDILEPSKNQYISIMINSGQFPPEFSKLEVTSQLCSSYSQFKKICDDAANTDLNQPDEEVQPHAANEGSTTSVFKVNKESLEKDYNMIELLLQNYNQIDLEKLRNLRGQAFQESDIIAEKEKARDGGLEKSHFDILQLKELGSIFKQKKPQVSGDLNIEEFLGKRAHEPDQFESLEELQRKGKQREFEEQNLQKLKVDSQKKIYRSTYPQQFSLQSNTAKLPQNISQQDKDNFKEFEKYSNPQYGSEPNPGRYQGFQPQQDFHRNIPQQGINFFDIMAGGPKDGTQGNMNNNQGYSQGFNPFGMGSYPQGYF